MNTEQVIVLALVILRVYCLVVFTILCLNALSSLVYKDQPRILREVTMFMILLTSGVVYGSAMSIYLWLNDLSNWSVIADPFSSFLLAVIFAAAATYGLKIFRPWRGE